MAGGRYAGEIERLKLMTSISASVPAQAAIADYLQHGGYDRHLRRLRYALESQQNAMLAAVARHLPEQTGVSRPDGGYFLWLEFPRQVDALRLFQLALARASASRRGRSSPRPAATGIAPASTTATLDAPQRAGGGDPRAHHQVPLSALPHTNGRLVQ